MGNQAKMESKMNCLQNDIYRELTNQELETMWDNSEDFNDALLESTVDAMCRLFQKEKVCETTESPMVDELMEFDYHAFRDAGIDPDAYMKIIKNYHERTGG